MVYNGRPSPGCAVCRSRKKRCDLKRPYCDRCLKSGRKCPGVPESIDLLFRQEFPQKNDLKVGSRRNMESMHSSVQQSSVFLTIPSISTDWITNAAKYYHVQCDKGPRQGQLNTWAKLLIRYYAASVPETGLYHAVNALAILKLSKDMHMPHLVDIANKSYGYALRTINNTLGDEVAATRNDVALAVFAMTTFELSPQNTNRHRRYIAHIEGMKRLLVLRGQQQFADAETLEVFRALRTQIVYDHILRGKSLINGGDESIWIGDSRFDETPMNDLCAIAPKVPGLRACIKSLNFQLHPRGIDCINAEALSVDSALESWYQKWDLDSTYEIRTVLHDELGIWRERAYVFEDISEAVLMTNYCFLHIQVLDTLLQAKRAIFAQDPCHNSQLLEIERRIHTLVDVICYSLPCITGQIRCVSQDLHIEDESWTYPSHAEASWILVPVVAVSQHGLVSQSQRSWLRLQLVHLNVDFGLVDRGSLLDEGDLQEDLTPFWNIDTPHSSGLKIPISKVATRGVF